MISQSLNTFSNFQNYPLQIQLRRRTREDKNLVRGEGNLLPSKKIKPPIRPGVFLCYKVNKVMADLDEFILTRKEIGKLLGISPNAVRMRARNGNQDNLEYRNIGGKILYKRPRANQDIRPPGRWYGKQKEMVNDIKQRLARAEATWDMAENIFQQLADQVRQHEYDIKDLKK